MDALTGLERSRVLRAFCVGSGPCNTKPVEGDGHDTIFDEGDDDRLVFNGISTNEIEFSRTALDLIITIKATGERVVLENQYVRDNSQGFAVEHFEFTDRTLLYSNFNPEDIDLVGTKAGETSLGKIVVERSLVAATDADAMEPKP